VLIQGDLIGAEVIVIMLPERVMDTRPAFDPEPAPEAPDRRRRRIRRPLRAAAHAA
jgi:hypothetical protein